MTILKMERASTIKSIINNKHVADQKQLIIELREAGYNITQATLSRQLKEMGISKVNASNGEYHYALLKDENNENHTIESYSLDNKIDTTHRITVVHTESGYACTLAKVIEHQLKDYIFGTIAGIDTIFVALTDKLSEDAINIKIKHIVETHMFVD